MFIVLILNAGIEVIGVQQSQRDSVLKNTETAMVAEADNIVHASGLFTLLLLFMPLLSFTLRVLLTSILLFTLVAMLFMQRALLTFILFMMVLLMFTTRQLFSMTVLSR